MLAIHPSISITVGTPILETNGLGLQYPSQLTLNDSLVSRRRTNPSLLTPYGLRTDNYVDSMRQIDYTASATPSSPGCCTRCARIAMETYVGHAASL